PVTRCGWRTGGSRSWSHRPGPSCRCGSASWLPAGTGNRNGGSSDVSTIEARHRDHRCQRHPGLGRHRPHPGLRALPNYEIRALSASSAAAARAAGEQFEVSAVFSDHEQLVTRPDIDVVAVTVKVPHHRELVSAALAAGKAVYSLDTLSYVLGEFAGLSAVSDL